MTMPRAYFIFGDIEGKVTSQMHPMRPGRLL